EVLSPARGAAAAAGPEEVPEAEEVPEHVPEVGEDLRVEAAEASAPADSGAAELIVAASSLRVGEDGVGLRGLLELLLGVLVPGVLVGMVLDREAAVGLLDRSGIRVPGNAQDLVVVSPGQPSDLLDGLLCRLLEFGRKASRIVEDDLRK